MKYLLGVYLTGGVLGAAGLALAGAGSVIATGMAIAVVILASGGALALCIHTVGSAVAAVERAKWDGRRAMLAATPPAATSTPRQLAPASITVDAVVLTPDRDRIYN